METQINMADITIEVLKDNEEDELSNLFSLVWNLNIDETKKRTLWAFKHTKALVLVAKHNNKIVGARGGFYWPLKYKDIEFDVIQFHNTCVHPNYRRQGIFSKLNLKFIDIARELGYKGIFNVSVKTSRLGYEKLGWKYLSGFHRLTKLNKPLSCIKHVKSLKKSDSINKDDVGDEILLNKVDFEIIEEREKLFYNHIHTRMTKEFLKWRLSNKQGAYKIFKNQKGFIIYKKNYRKNFVELIIGDVFLKENKYGFFKSLLDAVFKKEGQSITFTYIHKKHPYFRFYIRFFFIPNPINFNLNFGTKLLSENNPDDIFFSDSENWALSYLEIDTF